MNNYYLVYYFLPFFPFLTRSFIVVYFLPCMSDAISEKESDRDTHRGLILGMSGFSFSGLLALAIVNAEVKTNFDLAVFYLLISFLCYFLALNIQGYKLFRWNDQVSDCLIESASLSIILAIITIIMKSVGFTNYSIAIILISCSIWILDHIIRLKLSFSYLTILQASKKNKD